MTGTAHASLGGMSTPNQGEPVEPVRDADEVDQDRTAHRDPEGRDASDDEGELEPSDDQLVTPEDEDEEYEEAAFGDSWLDNDRGWGAGV